MAVSHPTSQIMHVTKFLTMLSRLLLTILENFLHHFMKMKSIKKLFLFFCLQKILKLFLKRM